MKKTLIFGFMAAALGFTACSSEDDAVLGENTQKKGMVLNATVELPAETRATIDDADASAWAFHFAENDQVRVRNNRVSGATYYTFKKDGTSFKSTDAQPTEAAATWYAYYPSENIDLSNQTGQLTGDGKSVANLYAMVGATAEATTGEEGLSITMQPKVAIIKINNQKGAIDIKVKNGDSFVTALTAPWNVANLTMNTNNTPNSFLTKSTTGTYYIVVPADAPLNIYDGDTKLKSTDGLTAGKYYELTIATTGTHLTNINDVYYAIKWVQLWAGGPKFAECNVGFSSLTAEDYGGYYTWGGSYKNGDGITWNGAHNTTNTGSGNLASTDDTATKLWGNAWRMPTEAELNTLTNVDDSDKCESEWTYDYNGTGVSGRIFKGKGDYASNSIFLPAAGYCYDVYVSGQGYSGYVSGQGGNYWSSTPYGSDSAYILSFSSSGQSVSGGGRRNGYSVRAVLAE